MSDDLPRRKRFDRGGIDDLPPVPQGVSPADGAKYKRAMRTTCTAKSHQEGLHLRRSLTAIYRLRT